MNDFTRTMVAVATKVLPQHCFISGAHTMYSFRSKLAVLVAVVSIVSIANSSRISAQTYDWTNLSDEQLTNFSAAGGLSVAISGDIAVVGDSGGNSNKGEVKLFERVSAEYWNELATLTASDAAVSDAFGSSVGISGDTVLVGAQGNQDQGSYTGSAYLFTKPGGGWATTSAHAAKLTPSDAFGSSVGISGDTVLVGAQGDETTGSAYVFTKPGAGWTTTNAQTAKLTASDGAALDPHFPFDFPHFGTRFAPTP